MINKLKYLLTFIVIGLGIINFSSAGCNVTQANLSAGNASGIHTIGAFANSTLANNTQYEHGVFQKGNVLSKLSGEEKKVFAVGQKFLFRFSESGLPYLYMQNGNNNVQGYFQYMLFCDEITSQTSGSISNCTAVDVDINEISSFLSTITNNDYWGYYLYINDYFNIGFSSSQLGKSLFFVFAPSSWLNCPLVNSEGYSELTFSSISNSLLYDSPGNSGSSGGGSNPGGGEGSSEGFVPLPSSYVCPTVGQLINQYDSSIYNTGLCYSSSLVYSGNSIVSVTPSSLFDLFSSRSDFNSYSNLYFSYCSNSVMNGSQCSTAFSGKDLQYSLLSKAYSSGKVKPGYLYEYCNLSLNYTPETSTCVGTGITINPSDISSDNIINSLVGGDYTIVSPLSGSIISDVLSGDYYTGDIISAVDTLFTSFTSLFSQQTGNTTGFLPGYIIVALLVIILFKFFKK